MLALSLLIQDLAGIVHESQLNWNYGNIVLLSHSGTIFAVLTVMCFNLRYQKKETQAHLCKAVRKNIITNIIRKYHLVESRVDNGRGRRRTTKKVASCCKMKLKIITLMDVIQKDLEAWKMRRAQGLEGWKRKKKKRRKKVISSKGKKKKFQQYKGCTTCGDYHFKRVCAANDLKVRAGSRR